MARGADSDRRSERDSRADTPGEAASISSGIGASEGERFQPRVDGPDLAYEHAHRYRVAAELVANLQVLDLCSGTGYGSAILESAGATVTALDLSLSALHSAAPGARVAGDAQRLPFADRSFEAVVCFEAIEHVEEPGALVSEVRRVLRSPGLFVCSTPDRRLYTEIAGHQNEHHVSELERGAFRALLEDQFETVVLRGQSVWAGSWLGALDVAPEGVRSVAAFLDPLSPEIDGPCPEGHPRRVASAIEPGTRRLPNPLYLVAACAIGRRGAQRIESHWPSDSVLHDPGQWLIAEYEAGQRALAETGDRLARARREFAELEQELAAARTVAEDQERSLEQARSDFARIEAEVESARATAVEQRAALVEARERFAGLEAAIERARDENSELTRSIETGREALREADLELDRLRGQNERDHEALLEARDAVAALDVEVETRNRMIEERDERLADAKRGFDILEAQLVDAKLGFDRLEEDIARARHYHQDLESQLTMAREILGKRDGELEHARQVIDAKAHDLEVAREAIDAGLEREHGLERRVLSLDADRRALVAKLEQPLVWFAYRIHRFFARRRRRDDSS